MNLSILRSELTDDPLGRGYATMNDSEAAESLNAADREIAREEIDPTSVFEALVPSEFNALSDAEKANIRMVLALPVIKIGQGTNGRAVLLAAFGAGTTTRTNLAALATRTGSRAELLGLGAVTHLHVAEARR